MTVAGFAMGRWTYYSPLLLGTLLAALMCATYSELLPPMSTGLLVTVLIGGCVLAGVLCQFLMVAAQGMLAQVLPVPGGRSIRGRGAVAGGGLLLLWVATGAVAALLRAEGLGTAAVVLAIVSLASLIGAVLIYLWCWPTAVRDFADKR